MNSNFTKKIMLTACIVLVFSRATHCVGMHGMLKCCNFILSTITTPLEILVDQYAHDNYQHTIEPDGSYKSVLKSMRSDLTTFKQCLDKYLKNPKVSINDIVPRRNFYTANSVVTDPTLTCDIIIYGQSKMLEYAAQKGANLNYSFKINNTESMSLTQLAVERDKVDMLTVLANYKASGIYEWNNENYYANPMPFVILIDTPNALSALRTLIYAHVPLKISLKKEDITTEIFNALDFAVGADRPLAVTELLKSGKFTHEVIQQAFECAKKSCSNKIINEFIKYQFSMDIGKSLKNNKKLQPDVIIKLSDQ